MKKGISLILLFAMLLTVLVGCGSKKKDDIVGEYLGTQGSYIKLIADGTCIYSEIDDTGSARGEWTIEEGFVYLEAENIGYPIYAEIMEEDTGLLFESDSKNWNAEYFSKQ